MDILTEVGGASDQDPSRNEVGGDQAHQDSGEELRHDGKLRWSNGNKLR